MMTAPKLDLSGLKDDGDTLELDDGRALRLRIVPDENYSINDYDSDGKVEWGHRDPHTGWECRPKGFNGNAEKLDIHDHGTALWWQPPAGLTIKRGSPEWRAERTRIRDLAVYGFKVVFLEVLSGSDGYGRPIVLGVANVGGVDECYPELLEELADELGELGLL